MTFLFNISLAQLVLASVVLLIPAARNLEYEYAWLLSMALLLGAMVICLAKQPRWWPNYQLMSWRTFIGMMMTPVVTFIPGSVIFATGQCPCSANGFFFWMILLVVPAAWLSLGLIQISTRVSKVAMPMRWVAVTLLPILSILLSLAYLWFFPQKRITSIALGFLHGPIYDRTIELDSGVVLARLFHGLLGLLAIVVAGGLISIRSLFFRLSVVVLIAVFGVSAQYPSQSHGLNALQRGLPKIITNAAVELHYVSRTRESDELAVQLANDALFHITEISEHLGVTLRKPISIFAYETESEKKLMFGGGQTDITDVWTPSVHIQLEESPHPTLRHELVHAVASFVSWHNIGFHPNMVLTEGLAMALAPNDYSLTFDQIAAGLIKSGRLHDIESLLNPLSFWSEAGGRSYIAAGSIIRWLGGQYGSSAVRSLYQGTTLHEVTGKTSPELLAEWKGFVLEKYDVQVDLLVENLTREPGVLADLCPHSIADLARKRSDGWLVRLRQPIGWDRDMWVDWRASLNPKDREARLDVFRKSIKTLFETDKSDPSGISVWIDVMEKSRVWPPKVIEDVEAAIIQSDLMLLAGNFTDSNALLQQIQNQMKIQFPGTAIARQIEVRAALASFASDIDQRAWRRYLAGWDSLPPVSKNGTWIEDYLRGRRQRNPGLEVVSLWISNISMTDEFPEIKKEWLKMAGRSFARLEHFEKAEQAYGELSELSRGESKSWADEQQRRMLFLKKTRP